MGPRLKIETWLKQLKENMPPIVYNCPICGAEIDFNSAYLVSGKYCPNCDHEINIPYSFWE